MAENEPNMVTWLPLYLLKRVAMRWEISGAQKQLNQVFWRLWRAMTFHPAGAADILDSVYSPTCCGTVNTLKQHAWDNAPFSDHLVLLKALLCLHSFQWAVQPEWRGGLRSVQDAQSPFHMAMSLPGRVPVLCNSSRKSLKPSGRDCTGVLLSLKSVKPNHISFSCLSTEHIFSCHVHNVKFNADISVVAVLGLWVDDGCSKIHQRSAEAYHLFDGAIST